MLEFCGQERLLIDANARIKLPNRLLEDFLRHGNGDAVLLALPEGALALYPESTYSTMRRPEADAFRSAAQSMLRRRELRQFGALCHPVKLTSQGRLTLPPEMQEAAALQPKREVVLAGVEIGIELWQPERWQAELAVIRDHQQERGSRELDQDLQMPPDTERRSL